MVMNHYRNIDKSKVQFDFLVHRSERGAYDDEIESMGGRIFRMCPIYPQNFVKYKKMLKAFFDEHPEYKILHSHMSELGCFAFEEAKKRNIPVRICHAHNAPNGFNLKSIMREYFKLKMRPYITHMFMCGYTSGLWLFGKKNKDKFIQVNNAIDAEKFRYNNEIGCDIRKALNISEDSLVIGHIGRFNKQKNHRFVIDVFNEIYKMNNKAVLILVGNGSLENEIKAKVKSLKLESNVLFLGVRDDIHKIVQCFDVFLFPSLFEGLGIVLIEAQAAGVPCITSENVVAKEAQVTSSLKYYPLERSAKDWAQQTLKTAQINKSDKLDEIKKSGFDISTNAKWLEEFYISQYEKVYEKD